MGRLCGEQGADGRSGAGHGAVLLTACPVRDPGAALRHRKAIAANLQGRESFCCVSGGDKVFREGQSKIPSPFNLLPLLTQHRLPAPFCLAALGSCFLLCILLQIKEDTIF